MGRRPIFCAEPGPSSPADDRHAGDHGNGWPTRDDAGDGRQKSSSNILKIIDTSGGGSATGIQRSPNLECPSFHMGVRLESNCCAENKAEFYAVKIRIPLA